MDEDIEHEYTDEVVCPACGYVHGDSWEFEDYDNEFECHECYAVFEFQRNIEITYSTKLKS
jgi:protein-arginine kinase activator protein McsA